MTWGLVVAVSHEPHTPKLLFDFIKKCTHLRSIFVIGFCKNIKFDYILIKYFIQFLSINLKKLSKGTFNFQQKRKLPTGH